MSFEPVAARELRGLARRGPAYAVRALYLACAAAVVYEGWRAEARVGLFVGPSAFAELGRRLFEDLFWIQLGFVSLVAAFAAAGSLQRELRNGTLDLLVLTPGGEAGIVRGVWAAAVGQAAALTLAGAPVLGICVYLGGAGPGDLAAAVGLTLAMAAFTAAFAVRAAAHRRSVSGAVATALAEIGATALLPLLAGIVTAGLAFVAALFAHPLYAALLLRTGLFDSLAFMGWPVSCLATLLWVRLLLRSAVPLLARRAREGAGPAAAPQPLPPFPWIPAWSSDVWDARPLLWKEIATRPARRLLPETRILAIGALYAVVYVVLAASQGRSAEGLRVLGGLSLGASVLLGAFLFPPDREDPLLAAPVSTSALVRAKLLGGAASPEALAIYPALLVATLVFAFRSGLEGTVLFATSAVLLLTLAFLLSALASLHARSPHVAFGLAAAAVFLTTAVLPAAWPPAADVVLPYRLFDALLPPPMDFELASDAIPRARAAFATSGPAMAAAAGLAYALILRRFGSRAGRR